MQDVLRAAETAKSKGTGKVGSKGSVSPNKVAPSQCCQRIAKTLLLPGAHIWRDNRGGEWAAHRKPYRRTSGIHFDNSGLDWALRVFLCRLWTQHFELGNPQSDYFVEGIFFRRMPHSVFPIGLCAQPCAFAVLALQDLGIDAAWGT